MLPCSSSTFTTSRSVGTECLCCVRPIAQHTIVAFEVRTASPTRRSVFSGSPVAATSSRHGTSAIAARYASNPLVCASMKSWSSTPPSRRPRLEQVLADRLEQRLVAAEADLHELVGELRPAEDRRP